jgi:hypothetical protein
LPTGFQPTLEDENGKYLADLGLLAEPTRMAIVPWLLVFFISDASSSRCSVARQRDGRLQVYAQQAHSKGGLRTFQIDPKDLPHPLGGRLRVASCV